MFDMYKPRILRRIYGLCAGGGRGCYAKVVIKRTNNQ